MLGQAIKEIRKQQGLSCSELARRAGFSISTIYGIETGVNENPSFNTVCAISDVLGVSLSFLGKFTNKRKAER